MFTEGSSRNDLYRFEPFTNTWNEVETVGTPPLPRYSASLVPVGTSSLYIFGGMGNAGFNYILICLKHCQFSLLDEGNTLPFCEHPHSITF